jgi:hypothetical protein
MGCRAGTNALILLIYFPRLDVAGGADLGAFGCNNAPGRNFRAYSCLLLAR